MQYSGVSQDEMEVTIRLGRVSRKASLCSTWPDRSRKLERLYGGPKRIAERDAKLNDPRLQAEGLNTSDWCRIHP
jgi:hypothetical protein